VADVLERPTEGHPTTAGRRPGAWPLLRDQVVHASRTPASLLVSLVLPVLFLVMTGLVAGATPLEDGASDAAIQRLVPGAAVFAVAMAAFVMLAFGVAVAAEQGVLKRLRGTLLPAWAYLAGRIVSTFWIVALTVTIVLGLGWLVHDVTPVAAGWLPMVVTLMLGTACLGALGLAIAGLVPDAEAVPGITLATFMPLVFLSGVFPLAEVLPDVVADIAGFLPLAPMIDATRAAFLDGVWAAGELAIVAGWAVIGAVVAVWRFRWEP